MQKFRTFLAWLALILTASLFGFGSVHLGFTVAALTGSQILGWLAWIATFGIWFYYCLSGQMAKRFAQIEGKE